MPEIIQGLWIGPRLSAMEQLCISSFLRNGHEFHLYVYQATDGIPPGTVVMDGNQILAAARIFTYYEHPTYAGFANFFRYKLLLEKGGWFVDADTMCLKPFDFPAAYVFASQGVDGARLVNVAATKAPAGSAVMQYAWDACERMDTGTLRWGVSGPELMTRAVEHYSLGPCVQPPEVFCPIDFPEWEKLLDPAGGAPFGPQTHGVHLWNEMWRRAGRDKDQPGHPQCLYEQWKRKYL